MKHAHYLLTLVVLSGLLPAASAVNPPAVFDFAGVKWSVSPAEARRVLAARPGVTFRGVQGPRHDFEGGTFSRWNARYWCLYFTDEKKFYCGAVKFQHDNPVRRQETFDDVRREISAKYGPPVKTGRDGNVQLVQWDVDPRTGDDIVRIELLNDPRLRNVRLCYTNKKLEKPGQKTASDDL